MAIRMNKIQAGMTLYDRQTVRMGNTMCRTLGEWKVEVLEVDMERRGATVRCGGT